MTEANTLTLTTEDGRQFTIPEWWENKNPERFYGLDYGGWPFMRHVGINSDGDEYEILYGLTECCGATHKGLDRGIGCRKCYNLVEENHDVAYRPVSKFVRLAVTEES